MKTAKRWERASLAACLWMAAACGDSGTPVETAGSGAPPAIPVSGTGAVAGSAGRASAGTGAPGAGQGAAGNAGAGGAAAAPVQAVAIINPLPGASGSAGAGGAAAGIGAAGTGGAAAGSGAGAGAAGTASAAGSGVTAGSSAAAGSGAAGSGAAGLRGMATFTKTRFGVDLSIMVTGCTDGKSYPVHIHEGMSCDSDAAQGPHWGAAAAMGGAAGSGAAGSGAAGSGAAGSGGSAAGSSGSAAGRGGSSAGTGGSGGRSGSGGSAAGTGGTTAGSSAAGSSAAAGSSGTPPLVLRGEDIPDIKCVGGMGMTVASRSTPDVRLTWTIGGEPTTNVVGHVIVVHEGAARIACGKIEMK